MFHKVLMNLHAEPKTTTLIRLFQSFSEDE